MSAYSALFTNSLRALFLNHAYGGRICTYAHQMLPTNDVLLFSEIQGVRVPLLAFVAQFFEGDVSQSACTRSVFSNRLVSKPKNSLVFPAENRLCPH